MVARLQAGAGLDDAEVNSLIAGRRTLSRRRSQNLRLSAGESERAVRVARISILANQIFGGRPGYAGEWLRSAKPALGDRSPLAVAATEPGARAVEELLVSLDEGMYG